MNLPSNLESPFLQSLLPFFGARLESPEMLGFLESHGFKLPKKLTTTPNGGAVHVIDKKRGIELAFSLGGDHPKHPHVRGPRKNTYVPILECVFLAPAFKEALPLGVTRAMTKEELKKRFGAPQVIFRDDAGQPELVRWQATVDPERDLAFRIDWWMDQGLDSSLCLGIRRAVDLFFLHDPWEDRAVLAQDRGRLVRPALFVEWAASRGGWRETPANAEGLKALREGRLSGIDFLLKHTEGCKLWAEATTFDPQLLKGYLGKAYQDDFKALFKDLRSHLPSQLPPEELEEPYPSGPVFAHYLALYEAGHLEGMKAILENRLGGKA